VVAMGVARAFEIDRPVGTGAKARDSRLWPCNGTDAAHYICQATHADPNNDGEITPLAKCAFIRAMFAGLVLKPQLGPMVAIPDRSHGQPTGRQRSCSVNIDFQASRFGLLMPT